MPKEPKSELSPADFGRLEKVDADELTLSCDGMTTQAVDWRCNRRVLKGVPKGLRLPLQIVSDQNGFRQVLPRVPLHRFLLCAAHGGRAIFNRKSTTTPDERQTHRLMSLLFKWSFVNQRIVNRDIVRGEDLWLCHSERADPTQQHVLPEIEDGGGHQSPKLIDPTVLLEWGRERATRLQTDPGATRDLVNLGLLEAAARGPDRLASSTPEQIQQMVKLSLLGFNQGKRPTDSTFIPQIEERLIDAVHKHLEWSAKDFHRWLWQDFDNLVQQISQRRGGQKVTRQVVRFVLYDLLWRAYGYVDNFVRLQMQAVRHRLDPALTAEEQRVFGYWYEMQPGLGGLAAVMFHHRFDMVSAVLTGLQISGGNDDRQWRDLLQALYWKTEMAENRRQADLTSKQHLRRGKPDDADFGT